MYKLILRVTNRNPYVNSQRFLALVRSWFSSFEVQWNMVSWGDIWFWTISHFQVKQLCQYGLSDPGHDNLRPRMKCVSKQYWHGFNWSYSFLRSEQIVCLWFFVLSAETIKYYRNAEWYKNYLLWNKVIVFQIAEEYMQLSYSME